MVDKNAEATRWFAASRRGVMLHDERAAFESWRGVPQNALRFAELEAIWQSLTPTAPMADIAEPAAHLSPLTHGRQIAAMVAFVSLTATVLTKIDGGWWNTLDWWSR